VNDISKGGAKVADVLTDIDCTLDISNAFNPVLTIMAWGANDYPNQTPIANFTASLQTAITAAKQYGDVLIMLLV